MLNEPAPLNVIVEWYEGEFGEELRKILKFGKHVTAEASKRIMQILKFL
jgi:hypothetical protein